MFATILCANCFGEDVRGYEDFNGLPIVERLPRHIYRITVLMPDGTPAKNAQLSVYDCETYNENSYSSDGNGNIEIEADGELGIWASKDSLSSEVHYCSNGKSEELQLKPAVNVTGKVVSFEKEPVSGATVSIFGYGSTIAKSVSGADGGFRFINLPQIGDCTISVESKNSYSRINLAYYESELQDSTLYLEFILPSPEVYTGKVLDGSTGQPITDFSIRFDGNIENFHSADGRFSLPVPERRLHKGRLFQISAEEYMPAMVDIDTRAEETRLWKAGHLKGRIIERESNRPISGATAIFFPELLWNAKAGEGLRELGMAFIQGKVVNRKCLIEKSDDEGFFPIRDEMGYAPFVVFGKNFAAAYVRKDANEIDDKNPIEISLPCESSIGGTLMFAGKPCARTTLKIDETSYDYDETCYVSHPIGRVETDDSGKFCVANLDAGIYGLEFSVPDSNLYVERPVEIGTGEVVLMGAETFGPEFYSIEGYVIADGNRIANAEVRFEYYNYPESIAGSVWSSAVGSSQWDLKGAIGLLSPPEAIHKVGSDSTGWFQGKVASRVISLRWICIFKQIPVLTWSGKQKDKSKRQKDAVFLLA